MRTKLQHAYELRGLRIYFNVGHQDISVESIAGFKYESDNAMMKPTSTTKVDGIGTRTLLRRCISCPPGSSSWSDHGALMWHGDEAHASLSWGGTPNTRQPSWCKHTAGDAAMRRLAFQRSFFIVSLFGRPCGYGVQRTCWADDEGKQIGGSDGDRVREALRTFAVIVGEETYGDKYPQKRSADQKDIAQQTLLATLGLLSVLRNFAPSDFPSGSSVDARNA
ncbi:hypothetical protein SCHPADRAFT_892018 [Schizopora paradoxa]|uniref:Uncharacterized protein n=1 Tax=Schizopora paradoxa TaxID=27342 RepID=A0A0H2S1P4_9AGAM|nr:hypothetical protein SCHPADRAFT_892018 [Schizopora paradoxa]